MPNELSRHHDSDSDSVDDDTAAAPVSCCRPVSANYEQLLEYRDWLAEELGRLQRGLYRTRDIVEESALVVERTEQMLLRARQMQSLSSRHR